MISDVHLVDDIVFKTHCFVLGFVGADQGWPRPF